MSSKFQLFSKIYFKSVREKIMKNLSCNFCESKKFSVEHCIRKISSSVRKKFKLYQKKDKKKFYKNFSSEKQFMHAPLTSKFLVQLSNAECGGLETAYKDSCQMFQHSDRMFEQILQISFKISFGA